MVRRRQRGRSLFDVLLPDGHKLWPDWLRRLDTLREDEAVMEIYAGLGVPEVWEWLTGERYERRRSQRDAA